MTNADRIRKMSNEELVSMFQNICCPYSLDLGEWKGPCIIETKGCNICWLNWLKQASKVDRYRDS